MKSRLPILILASCILMLTACGNAQEIDYENLSPKQRKEFVHQFNEAVSEALEEVGPLERQVKVTPQSTTSNIQLAEQILDQLNKHSLNFSGEVTDSTADEKMKAHQEIVIHVMERHTRNSYEQSKQAIDAGTATSAEISTIYELQLIIEEAAKELEKEEDLLRVIYLDANNEAVSLAIANKKGSILPLVE